MTGDAVVDAALAAVARGQAVCVPGFGYRLLVELARHGPGAWSGGWRGWWAGVREWRGRRALTAAAGR